MDSKPNESLNVQKENLNIDLIKKEYEDYDLDFLLSEQNRIKNKDENYKTEKDVRTFFAIREIIKDRSRLRRRIEVFSKKEKFWLLIFAGLIAASSFGELVFKIVKEVYK